MVNTVKSYLLVVFLFLFLCSLQYPCLLCFENWIGKTNSTIGIENWISSSAVPFSNQKSIHCCHDTSPSQVCNWHFSFCAYAFVCLSFYGHVTFLFIPWKCQHMVLLTRCGSKILLDSGIQEQAAMELGKQSTLSLVIMQFLLLFLFLIWMINPYFFREHFVFFEMASNRSYWT